MERERERRGRERRERRERERGERERGREAPEEEKEERGQESVFRVLTLTTHTLSLLLLLLLSQAALACGATRLRALGDSALVINQLDGAWAAKVETLAAARDRCRALRARFPEYSDYAKHVRRFIPGLP